MSKIDELIASARQKNEEHQQNNTKTTGNTTQTTKTGTSSEIAKLLSSASKRNAEHAYGRAIYQAKQDWNNNYDNQDWNNNYDNYVKNAYQKYELGTDYARNEKNARNARYQTTLKNLNQVANDLNSDAARNDKIRSTTAYQNKMEKISELGTDYARNEKIRSTRVSSNTSDYADGLVEKNNRYTAYAQKLANKNTLTDEEIEDAKAIIDTIPEEWSTMVDYDDTGNQKTWAVRLNAMAHPENFAAAAGFGEGSGLSSMAKAAASITGTDISAGQNRLNQAAAADPLAYNAALIGATALRMYGGSAVTGGAINGIAGKLGAAYSAADKAKDAVKMAKIAKQISSVEKFAGSVAPTAITFANDAAFSGLGDTMQAVDAAETNADKWNAIGQYGASIAVSGAAGAAGAAAGKLANTGLQKFLSNKLVDAGTNKVVSAEIAKKLADEGGDIIVKSGMQNKFGEFIRQFGTSAAFDAASSAVSIGGNAAISGQAPEKDEIAQELITNFIFDLLDGASSVADASYSKQGYKQVTNKAYEIADTISAWEKYGYYGDTDIDTIKSDMVRQLQQLKIDANENYYPGGQTGNTIYTAKDGKTNDVGTTVGIDDLNTALDLMIKKVRDFQPKTTDDTTTSAHSDADVNLSSATDAVSTYSAPAETYSQPMSIAADRAVTDEQTNSVSKNPTASVTTETSDTAQKPVSASKAAQVTQPQQTASHTAADRIMPTTANTDNSVLAKVADNYAKADMTALGDAIKSSYNGDGSDMPKYIDDMTDVYQAVKKQINDGSTVEQRDLVNRAKDHGGDLSLSGTQVVSAINAAINDHFNLLSGKGTGKISGEKVTLNEVTSTTTGGSINGQQNQEGSRGNSVQRNEVYDSAGNGGRLQQKTGRTQKWNGKTGERRIHESRKERTLWRITSLKGLGDDTGADSNIYIAPEGFVTKDPVLNSIQKSNKSKGIETVYYSADDVSKINGLKADAFHLAGKVYLPVDVSDEKLQMYNRHETHHAIEYLHKGTAEAVDKGLEEYNKTLPKDKEGKTVLDRVLKMYADLFGEKMTPAEVAGEFRADMVAGINRWDKYANETFKKVMHGASEAAKKATDDFVNGKAEKTYSDETKKRFEKAGLGVDSETKAVFSVKYSTALLNLSKVDREKLINDIAKMTGRTRSEAEKFVQAEEVLAISIKDTPLDFEADPREKAIKNDSDYPQGTIDFTNICPKREGTTKLLNKLQEALPEDLFTADDYADIRLILIHNGEEVACGLCFVEDRRQYLGEIAQGFIEDYKKAITDGKTLHRFNSSGEEKTVKIGASVAKRYGVETGEIKPIDIELSQEDFISTDKWKNLQENHPEVAAAFEAYNNARGQSAGRLLLGRGEYDRDVLTWSDERVKYVNSLGGLRIFSFSDFDVLNLLDLIQVIEDCSARGVKIQGYSKQPDFAKLVTKTGLKLNRSLIPYGATGLKTINGKKVLAIDNVEGINTEDINFLDEKDNPNIGNVIIGINDEQIHVAMTDNFVHYIIGFHTNKREEINYKLGVGKWSNYKLYQTDKTTTNAEDIKKVALLTDKYKRSGLSDTEAYDKAVKQSKTKFSSLGEDKMINIYTDVLPDPKVTDEKSFTNKFLEVCRDRNIVPRFPQFLNVDKDGNYVYTEGYSKLLVDFKLFDYETGELLPQGKVTPDFDSEFIKSLIDKELAKSEETNGIGGHSEKTFDEVLNYIKVKHGHKGNKKLYEQTKQIIEDTVIKSNSDENGTKGASLSPSHKTDRASFFSEMSDKKIKESFFKNTSSEDEYFGKQLNDWIEGLGKKNGTYNGKYFKLGKTPQVYLRNGAKQNDLVMYENVAIKLTGGKHSISTEELAKLPTKLEDPILLFRGNKGNSYVALTDLVDNDGNDLIAIIYLNRKSDRYNVDKVQSVYAKSDEVTGRNNIVKYVNRQIDIENLVDVSKEKAVNWFTSRGLQLPKLVQTMLTAKENISQDKKISNNLKEKSGFFVHTEPEALKNAYHKYNDPSRWEAERVGDANKKPMSMTNIIAKVRHDFGLNITNGYVRAKNVNGFFDPKNKNIRTKYINNLPTTAHELGHALSDRFDIVGNKDLPKELRIELANSLGEKRTVYEMELWNEEGWAEYVRKYFQNSAETAKKYPKITELLKKSLSGKELAVFEELADEFNAYYALDAETATSSIRLAEEGVKDFRTVKEKLKDKYDEFYQAFVDSNLPLKQIDREMGSNVYTYATNAAYSDNIAGEIIYGNDLTGMEGQYIGPGLRTCLSGVNITDKEEYRLFGEFLVMRHASDFKAGGKTDEETGAVIERQVFADDRKDTYEFFEKRYNTLKEQHPTFEDAAEMLDTFQDQLVREWGIKSGLINEKSYNELRKQYPHYVPFHRAMEKGGNGKSARKGFANQSTLIMRAKGSGRDIIHPVDSIINNIVRYVNAGKRNEVMRKLCDTAVGNDALNALYMEKIPTPMIPKTFTTEGIKKQIREQAKDIFNPMANTALDGILDTIDDTMTQFSRGKAGGDIVTVMKDGKPEYWKVNDPSLLQAITNMNPSYTSGFLGFLGKITRFMTANITGNNPIWGFFSNGPRDIGSFIGYFPEKKYLLEGLMKIPKAYVDSFKQTFMGGEGVSPLYKEYLAMGGGHTSAYSADIELAKKARKSLRSTKFQKALDMANPVNLIAFITDTIESGPRFALYNVLRTHGMNSEEAFFNAMDITTNFKKGGATSKELNNMFHFFNASVQGVDKFARYFSGDDVKGTTADRAKVVRNRWFVFTAVSAALAAIFYAINNANEEAEEDYEQLSTYTKNNFFCIPLGDGKYFTIPKPRELTVLMSAMTDALEYTVGDNKNAYSEFYSYAVDSFAPPVASDLLELPENIAENGVGEGIEESIATAIGSAGIIGIGANLVSNRDFLGRPIESSSLSNYEAKDRYTDSTSKLAYWMGQAFDLSPQQVDYVGNNVLGYLWKSQKALFPVGEENRDLTLGVKSTYVKDNLYSVDLINWLYDERDKSQKSANSNKDDASKQLTYKLNSNMVSFYANFNSLNKNNSDTASKRSLRQSVMTMISDYQNSYDSDAKGVEASVYDVIKETGDTSVLPQVLGTTIKQDGVTYTLTDAQYYEYQTGYNDKYWTYIEQNIDNGKTAEEKASIIEQAKKQAKLQADAYALKAVGADSSEYDTQISTADSRSQEWTYESLLSAVSGTKAYKDYSSSGKDIDVDKWMNDYLQGKDESWITKAEDANIDIDDAITYKLALKLYDTGNSGSDMYDEYMAILSMSGLTSNEKQNIWENIAGNTSISFDEYKGSSKYQKDKAKR